jgi:hypothetical protein
MHDRPPARIAALEVLELTAGGRPEHIHASDASATSRLPDSHLLVRLGARERTKAEYDAAGCSATTLHRTPNTWNVLETRFA